MRLKIRILSFHCEAGQIRVRDGPLRSAFRFDLVAIRLVLWLEPEILVCWAKEHLAEGH